MTQHLTQEAADFAGDLNNPIEERLTAILGQHRRLGQARHTAATQLEFSRQPP